MTFDERGRVWITESLEYPRHEAGPGQDRVKILEDTDGDGRADKFTDLCRRTEHSLGHRRRRRRRVGGQCPRSAVLPGHRWRRPGRSARGGPHRLRPQRHARAAQFAHLGARRLALWTQRRLQSAATSSIRGASIEFTCALFRIHPRTRAFELFAEGTSNPWGVAWDSEGSAFLSACVIDHLWHLTETGYYIRQGGPYPPFTSIAGSIVQPPPSKGRLLRHPLFRQRCLSARVSPAALHGQHSRRLPERRPAGARRLDLSRRSNAPTFSPPTTPGSCPWCKRPGPTAASTFSIGTIAITAIRTPAAIRKGIDRLKGRLYRIRYQDTPHAGPFDLANESDEQLIARLASPNVFYRDLAQRLLWERNHAETRPQLERLVLDDAAPRAARMHALWALVGTGTLDGAFHRRLLAHADPTLSGVGRSRGRQLRPRRCRSRPGRAGPGRRSGARRAAASGDRRAQARRRRCRGRAARRFFPRPATTS